MYNTWLALKACAGMLARSSQGLAASTYFSSDDIGRSGRNAFLDCEDAAANLPRRDCLRCKEDQILIAEEVELHICPCEECQPRVRKAEQRRNPCWSAVIDIGVDGKACHAAIAWLRRDCDRPDLLQGSATSFESIAMACCATRTKSERECFSKAHDGSSHALKVMQPLPCDQICLTNASYTSRGMRMHILSFLLPSLSSIG